MRHTVTVGPDYELWVEERGDADAPPLLLIMGANYSGMAWPESFVERLTSRYRVIRYDHRDTGRSSRAFDVAPYTIADLAEDAVAVLDALDVDSAHVVGMSLGGVLVQLLLLDHPERLRSATVFATSALGGAAPESGELPGPDPRILSLWQRMGEQRDPADELAWRVEHWRMLNGDVLPFDPEEFRDLEQRLAEHSGTHVADTAHARAEVGGLDRAAELSAVTTPTLVIEAPADPVNPPPHAEHLEAVIAGSHRITVPGMGHALSSAVLEPLAEAILRHTAAVDRDS
ncbi:Pimeloyl-ACP methyl ester carboxylesterase [Actinopolyspora lacussalsi subsp. righensis]|uniref:Pimeloyl-ACP methyl ester carboxylesterase n=1 Tax=Actinopolyspora righensis TaxID=995060 RepID=A0A1I7BZM4_9ACTN|nr:alpha/beta hydrolase [Actinopolyspora righensis]SFT92568.1 Pimeloyl-ACP methyl ester carboxylesterase [Actinopolyspora righensis]